MAIILEGMDGGGKSTLAASFGLDVVHPGPRPTSKLEEARCISRQLVYSRRMLVMDRVTAISTPCYTGNFSSLYRRAVDAMIRCGAVIVYCRPPIEIIKDFSRHVIKSYDDETKLKWIHDHAEEIVGRYDIYMSAFPHMRYDYTNPDPSVPAMALEAISTPQGMESWNFLTKRQLELTLPPSGNSSQTP